MFKSLGRMALLALVVVNGMSSASLFGMQEGKGKKKEEVQTRGGSEAGPSSGRCLVQPDERRYLREFAAAFETELEVTYESKSAKSEPAPSVEELKARLEFAKERKVLPQELVESLIKGCPDDLMAVLKTFKRRESASDGLPKLIILVGEPGVGKSELSRAIAQCLKFDIEFIRSSFLGDEWRKSSEKDLRAIFDPLFCNAKKPVFVVFDELQVLTAARRDRDQASEVNVGTSVWQLIDKYIDEKNIYIIGTLNKEEDLPAPLAGRAKIIEIPLPQAKARGDILAHHLYNLKNPGKPSKKGTVIDVSCRALVAEIARSAENFSGRDLFFVVQNAIQKATNREDSEKEASKPKDLRCGCGLFDSDDGQQEDLEEEGFVVIDKERVQKDFFEANYFEDDYVVVKGEDLQKAFEEQKRKVEKRVYPQGRHPNLTWKNAGIVALGCFDRALSVTGLLFQMHTARRQMAAQDLAFRYQRMVTLLPYYHNMWVGYKDHNAATVLHDFERRFVPSDQRISHPFLDLSATHNNWGAIANAARQCAPGVAAAASSIAIGSCMGTGLSAAAASSSRILAGLGSPVAAGMGPITYVMVPMSSMTPTDSLTQ